MPISMLLDFLDEAFDRKSWHGPNLWGSIRGVRVQEAAWRPGPGRHNIWELVLHTAYWKYVVRRRLTGEKRGSFVLPGSNFFERPHGVLLHEHQQLRATIASLSLAAQTAPQTARLIRGIAAHDLYHAGQIRLLRRSCAASVNS